MSSSPRQAPLSCKRAGYRLIRRTGLNGWYAPQESAPPLDWQGRWEILRKYYLAFAVPDPARIQAPDARPHPARQRVTSDAETLRHRHHQE
jgi:hypothetical protein